jgi:hypothetical protein
LPVELADRPDLDASTVVVVDGYEQLSRWSRARLKRLCRRRGWGLLVTSHKPLGFPSLFQTAATLDVARRVVAHLLPERREDVGGLNVEQCYERSGGNIREMLFELYDRYERTRAERASSTE